jgi:SAM-dependent methyltransferase
MKEMIKESREYWDEMAQHGPDASVADPYDNRGSKNKYVDLIESQAILDALADIPPSARILDFGCGSGNISKKLDDIGYRPVGVDISFNLLKYTHRHEFRGAVLFVQYDGRNLPHRAGSFDACVTNGVLQFVLDNGLLHRTLDDIFRVLKPGGRLVASDHTHRNSVYQPQKKKVMRSEKEIVELLSRSGFRIKESNVVRRGHFPWIYLIRYGLIPSFLLPYLGKIEILWGKLFGHPIFDYANTVIVAEKPERPRKTLTSSPQNGPAGS